MFVIAVLNRICPFFFFLTSTNTGWSNTVFWISVVTKLYTFLICITCFQCFHLRGSLQVFFPRLQQSFNEHIAFACIFSLYQVLKEAFLAIKQSLIYTFKICQNRKNQLPVLLLVSYQLWLIKIFSTQISHICYPHVLF